MEEKILSFAAGILYLSSRMAYYQIGQFYGLMESLALWAALGILWFLYRYVNEKKTGAFLAANVLYFVVSFIHERYMVLLPLLLLTVILGFGKVWERKMRPRNRRKKGTGARGRARDAAVEEDRAAEHRVRKMQQPARKQQTQKAVSACQGSCSSCSRSWYLGDPDDPSPHDRNAVTGRNRRNGCGRYLPAHGCDQPGDQPGGIRVWEKLRTGLSLH